MRIDKYLQEKFNLRSRTYAENLVKKGLVQVNGNKVVKTSFDVNDGDDVKILSDENYASQGAYKLLEAINKFSLNLDGLDCIDVGCSNGGFTDCLLRHDANRVLAVDVADCALPENILADPRVEFLKANARNLVLEEKFDFACSDVSFISLRYILPTLFSALKNGGRAVVLVKPQFELDKSALNKKGIVTSERDREKAVAAVRGYASDNGFTIEGFAVSPVFYEDKNVEYLMLLRKPD